MPVNTTLTVRVIANGGKFLGADIGGAAVTVYNAATNEVLAAGTTTGGSGDIWQIMVEPRNRTQPIPTDGASAFTAVITTPGNNPVQLRIKATGPGAGLQSGATSTTTQWIVPGLVDTTGTPVEFNCLLELPGLLVQVMEPATHWNISTLPQPVTITANVAMMCGCPIDNNTDTDGSNTFPNPWPVDDFMVSAMILLEGVYVTTVPLPFVSGGLPGAFSGSWTMTDPGFYTATVVAYQLSTGNTGVGVVSFFNQPPA